MSFRGLKAYKAQLARLRKRRNRDAARRKPIKTAVGYCIPFADGTPTFAVGVAPSYFANVKVRIVRDDDYRRLLRAAKRNTK